MTLDELLDACDSSAAPYLQMPKMVGLIKQLKKELNLQKILEGYRSKNGKSVMLMIINSSTIIIVFIELQKSKRLDVTRTITTQGDMIKLNQTNLTIPGGALAHDTSVTLSNMSSEEIHQALQSSPWASMLNVVTAFNVTCNPPLVRFNVPVIASIRLPYRDQIQSPPFRVLQSKFMNNWIDITDEPSTEVTIENDTLTLRTNHTGWLLVATISLNVSQLLQMAVKSLFAEEPITLQVNIFGRKVSEKSTEITTFVTPITKDDSSLNQKKEPPSTEHKRISFPHSFKAFKGQRIRLELQGSSDSRGDLASEHVVDGQLEAVMTKDMCSTPGNVQKLIINKFCNTHNEWENVQEITL